MKKKFMYDSEGVPLMYGSCNACGLGPHTLVMINVDFNPRLTSPELMFQCVSCRSQEIHLLTSVAGEKY